MTNVKLDIEFVSKLKNDQVAGKFKLIKTDKTLDR
jgi:hypothetical protein